MGQIDGTEIHCPNSSFLHFWLGNKMRRVLGHLETGLKMLPFCSSHRLSFICWFTCSARVALDPGLLQLLLRSLPSLSLESVCRLGCLRPWLLQDTHTIKVRNTGSSWLCSVSVSVSVGGLLLFSLTTHVRLPPLLQSHTETA